MACRFRSAVGVDQTEHAETAYDWGGLSGSLHRAAVSVAAATATSPGSVKADAGESEEEKVTVS